MSKEHKIQQQYYTRAREGIFRTNEGLDTVAKSPALDNNFIKKTLHPFCVYHAPQELSQRGEKDLAKYPESLTVFHADSGELVIGRSMYAGADFTGQRDTIFAHNYVIPKERKEAFLRSADEIFRIEHFQSQYDVQNGKILPELEDIAYSQESYLYNQQAILDKLGVDEKLFKQLLWAFMMSISSNKKVYIALDVDVEECSLYATRLTEIMFHCLPYELRRRFGFTTYDNEPQGKKYIDVMFVEKGSIRVGDRNLDKDFLFDFPNQRFVNVDLPGQEQYYLDYAWASKERPEGLTAFYVFAEEALQGIDDVGKKLAVSTYYQLCALFLVESGYAELYSNNKEGVLNSILSYLDAATVAQKPRLSQLFNKLVGVEVAFIHTGRVVSVDYLQAMMDYYRIADDGVKQEFVSHLTQFLYNGWNHHDDSNHTVQVLQSMQRQPDLFKAVIRQLHSEEKLVRVFKDYVQGKIEPIASIKGIQEEIAFWMIHSPEGVTGTFFQDQCLHKVQQLLEKDRDKIVGGKHLYEFVKKLNRSPDKRLFASFCEELELKVAKCVLSQIELGQLSAADFDNLNYLNDEQSAALTNRLDAKDKEKLQVLRDVSSILGNQLKNEMEIFTIIDEMPQAQFEHTQRMLQRFLRDRVSAAQYAKITYAFYRRNSGRYNKPEFRYMEMLAYVHSASKEIGEIYDFLVWTASNSNMHLGNSTQIIETYKKAIRSFFDQQARGALKNKTIRRKLFSSANGSFKKLIKEIKLEQSNLLKRFIVKNRSMIALSTLGTFIAVVIVGGGWFAYQYFFPKSQPQPQQEQQLVSSPAPTSTSTPTLTPTLTPTPMSTAGN